MSRGCSEGWKDFWALQNEVKHSVKKRLHVHKVFKAWRLPPIKFYGMMSPYSTEPSARKDPMFWGTEALRVLKSPAASVSSASSSVPCDFSSVSLNRGCRSVLIPAVQSVPYTLSFLAMQPGSCGAPPHLIITVTKGTVPRAARFVFHLLFIQQRHGSTGLGTSRAHVLVAWTTGG